MMRRVWWIVVAGIALGTIMGCGQKQTSPRPEEVAAQKVQQAMEAGQSGNQADLPMVAVAPEGTHFDPPVQPGQIPAGAWYCDMGTVHFARMDRGDGVCPECGMSLTRQPGAAQAPSP